MRRSDETARTILARAGDAPAARTPRTARRAAPLARDGCTARLLRRLPAPILHGPVRADWCYRPSASFAGDAFTYGRLDATHFQVALLDVSGHGPGAARHALAVLDLLSRPGPGGVEPRDPAAVLTTLNARLAMEAHGNRFVTAWIGVYSIDDRQLLYAAAGHPPAILRAPGRPAASLGAPGLVIGASPAARWRNARAAIPPGSVLYLFSDGVYETRDRDGHPQGLEDFLPMLGRGPAGPGEAEALYEAVRRRTGAAALDDDFSLLILRFD